MDSRRQWFKRNQGTTVPWSELSRPNFRLASAPKGIFKPAGEEYALSIRIMLDGPYLDGAVHSDERGWVLSYHQEGADPESRDNEYTNRALVSCQKHREPVGVLRESRALGSRVTYDVLGLAYVDGWSDGYFFLRSAGDHRPDTVNAVIEAEARAAEPEPSMPADDYDARIWLERTIVARQGQQKLRLALIEAQGGRCMITGCDVLAVLDAAHISPYRGPDSDKVSNALLLRTDLHNPFDRALLAFDPSTGQVRLSSLLRGTSYAELDGSVAFGWESGVTAAHAPALERAWRRFQSEEANRRQ